MTSERPPIRVMTRLLANLQTSIVADGIHLTQGSLDRFTILALIVGQSAAADPLAARPVSVMSLANSLSKPYETVRRHVAQLVASGLCERRRDGLHIASDAGAAGLNAVLVHTHDAFVRFVEDLQRLGIPLPARRSSPPYRMRCGLRAAVDIMLSVLDGNRGTHDEWAELVIFSAILSINVDRYARDPALALALADETMTAPPQLAAPVRANAVAGLLRMAETTVRRHVERMIRDGRLERRRAGLVVSDLWLNRPDNVQVSRASFANVRRVLDRLAADGFPFDAPATAYCEGRPGNVARRIAAAAG